MAALASTDVTITVQQKRISNGSPAAKRNRIKIAFGDGALTYPSGGVPLPAFSSLGMKRYLQHLELIDGNDGSGIVWKYDQENHKLRAYISGVTVSAAGAATMDDFPLNTTSDPLASAVSVSLTNSAGAGTHYLGALKELATTAAPVAQVLYAIAVGW